MLRYFLLFTCCFLASAVEIQVRAGQMVDEPPHCLREEGPCIVKAKADKQTLEWDGGRSVLAKNTLVIRNSSTSLQIVQGRMLWTANEVEHEGSVEFTYGSLHGVGQILIEKDQHKTLISVLNGEATIVAKGHAEPLTMLVGYTLTISRVDDRGLAFVEVPQASPIQSTIKKWWSVFEGNRKEFLTANKIYAKSWQSTVESASQLHRDLAERYIANVESERIRLARQRELADRENRKMRELFRKNNYLSD